MLDIQTNEFHVGYEAETSTINCQGTLQLNGTQGYAPIAELFDEVLEQAPPKITLDVKQLEFLNSSGINMISKFIIKVRKKKNIQIIVKGSQKLEWQDKLLRNLGLLMPGLRFEKE